jgi:hypothetical protein
VSKGLLGSQRLLRRELLVEREQLVERARLFRIETFELRRLFLDADDAGFGWKILKHRR